MTIAVRLLAVLIGLFGLFAASQMVAPYGVFAGLGSLFFGAQVLMFADMADNLADLAKHHLIRPMRVSVSNDDEPSS